MTPLRVLVIGGTGFLGQHIVKAAVAVGAEVASVSRRGQPTFAGSRVPLWATKVSWHSADILSPTSYASHLANTDAVVYTVGTLFDDTSYKKNVREGNVVGLAAQVAGRALTGAVECVVGGADRVGQSVGGTAGATVRQAASVASMAAQTVGSMAGGTVGRSEQSGGGGYESLNRDGALLLARTIPTYPSIRTFVYISSADLPLPAQLVVDRRYIETKREAEAVVMEGDREGQWRGVVVRPGECGVVEFGDASLVVDGFKTPDPRTYLPLCFVHPPPISHAPPHQASYTPTTDQSRFPSPPPSPSRTSSPPP
ncbi:NAD(P)-binding protein [Gonapodya prolifera JEL478]|uniref:NAD(P)-binding protein n=1 Tax=Gonapodya prolifera (strain JEL478) TaxID=1344416 RepID=A0A139A4I4_GONPJ|nr:NAD(P)-binding protein [Gonapodya prolifera JEL478]|eukprot:KXS11700.1 NAD(P)-binding protein [Gonapodya prolifera JEL478]